MKCNVVMRGDERREAKRCTVSCAHRTLMLNVVDPHDGGVVLVAARPALEAAILRILVNEVDGSLDALEAAVSGTTVLTV